jgi:hypothetical protein
MDFTASIQTNFSGAHSDFCKANFSVRLKYVGATRTHLGASIYSVWTEWEPASVHMKWDKLKNM